MYLHFACVTIAGVAGILLALNFRDSAYRVYELLMNRSPVSPGFGFSPLIIRITGAVLGISLIVQLNSRRHRTT
ncbi:hypothetical protein G3I29_26730 [Streptomyces halstedii]|uniref:Uncharacterized protein n=1 Tax=Streptomyces halstedii TaxID=1944 RepID=A0A6N9U5D3_STRHA|nr:hypothetical protein [Streptomyces halstedii]